MRTKPMNCTICGKPVILVPSARERAKKYGGKPDDYTNLFTSHAQCVTDKRTADTLDLMRRLATRKAAKSAAYCNTGMEPAK